MIVRHMYECLIIVNKTSTDLDLSLINLGGFRAFA